MNIVSPPLPRIPVSTYRLQFNPRFTFSDAMKLVPYLNDLGITDIYASPCFKARKGSTHGYDITDPNTMNPELGGEKGFNGLAAELEKYGMGLILDIVPNHMCIEDKENVWWMDVLENGPSSLYANFFDIDWHPVKPELENRVLIPVLGDQYGAVLENRELNLAFDQGCFFVYFHEYKFPILPETYIDILNHGIESDLNTLPSDDPHLIELLSILTALRALPTYIEREETRIVERRREKEIIKSRLNELCNQSMTTRHIIDETIRLFNGTKGDPGSFNLIDKLLGRQVWRLSHWRVATDEINYRKFFDINGLAAIRIEDPMVFQKTHELVFRLIEEGKVTGLRVDHPDGLYNPPEYFRRLQRECYTRVRLGEFGRNRNRKRNISDDQAFLRSEILKEFDEAASSAPQYKPFYIIGEKILTKSEHMPEDWSIYSTIGYAFLNPLNGIFVDTENSKTFDTLYSRFIGSKTNYQDLLYEKKRLIMFALMSGEINTLGHFLNEISEKNRHTRDFTLNSLRAAIMDVIACFPIYRTYLTPAAVNERDLRYIEQAVAKAKGKDPSLSKTVFDFLQRVLQLNYPGDLNETDRSEWGDFVMKFQQTTGPIMAKGVEDTVFYVYNRLVSLNEVGGNPERFGTTLDAFHGKNIETTRSSPHSQIATSTHDTKRSEDARARLNVLSEMPGEWRNRLVKWSRLNKRKKSLVDGRRIPDRNEEYLLYQTLISIWQIFTLSDPDYETFKMRIKDNMVKAVREAKINSSWISPDIPYEDGLTGFVEAILSRSGANLFVKDFIMFQEKISYLGFFNSLSQTLLKIASPGVPDFYQGTELWDLSLVDPDNRRPVDFRIRMKMLKKVSRGAAVRGDELQKFAHGLLQQWHDGAIKFYVMFMSLRYRNQNQNLFKNGLYTPLMTDGSAKESVCTFARTMEDKAVIVAAPRFLSRLIKNIYEMPLGQAIWTDTTILIPDEIPRGIFSNILTGEIVEETKENGKRRLLLENIFASFPLALLERQDRAESQQEVRVRTQ
jgi:(1->4)-alpha-D-glucan 1-alpha-D-glucosylmutase